MGVCGCVCVCGWGVVGAIEQQLPTLITVFVYCICIGRLTNSYKLDFRLCNCFYSPGLCSRVTVVAGFALFFFLTRQEFVCFCQSPHFHQMWELIFNVKNVYFKRNNKLINNSNSAHTHMYDGAGVCASSGSRAVRPVQKIGVSPVLYLLVPATKVLWISMLETVLTVICMQHIRWCIHVSASLYWGRFPLTSELRMSLCLPT